MIKIDIDMTNVKESELNDINNFLEKNNILDLRKKNISITIKNNSNVFNIVFDLSKTKIKTNNNIEEIIKLSKLLGWKAHPTIEDMLNNDLKYLYFEEYGNVYISNNDKGFLENKNKEIILKGKIFKFKEQN